MTEKQNAPVAHRATGAFYLREEQIPCDDRG